MEHDDNSQQKFEQDQEQEYKALFDNPLNIRPILNRFELIRRGIECEHEAWLKRMDKF